MAKISFDTYVESLIYELIEIHLEQKAISVSGFSQNSIVAGVKALGEEAFIKKPYRIKQLGEAVLKGLQ